MHILYVTPYMNLGGTERCIINLIFQSLKSGCKVFLISPTGDSLERLPPGVKVCKLKNWMASRPLTAVSELKKALLDAGKKIDIIHVHAAAEMAYLAKKYLPEKPVIFTCHGYDNALPSYSNYWLAAKFLKKIDVCVVLNPLDKDYFIRAGIKRENLFFIPNGVDERFFSSPNTKDTCSKVVGIVGRLVRQKNIKWAIKTQAKFKFASKFLIVGEGPLRKKLENYVKMLELDDQIQFLGYQEKVENIYPLFSYLLVCSRNEAFALIVLEALASGTAVFIPGWLPGLVRLWGSSPGVFVFEDGKDLKEKIEMRRGKDDVEKIQDFARNFSWKRIFKKYEKLYNQLLKRDDL